MREKRVKIQIWLVYVVYRLCPVNYVNVSHARFKLLWNQYIMHIVMELSYDVRVI